jgi:hypothetical protein
MHKEAQQQQQQQQVLPSSGQPPACLLAMLLAGVQLALQLAGNSSSCSSEGELRVVLPAVKVLLQQLQQCWMLGLLNGEQRSSVTSSSE